MLHIVRYRRQRRCRNVTRFVRANRETRWIVPSGPVATSGCSPFSGTSSTRVAAVPVQLR